MNNCDFYQKQKDGKCVTDYTLIAGTILIILAASVFIIPVALIPKNT